MLRVGSVGVRWLGWGDGGGCAHLALDSGGGSHPFSSGMWHEINVGGQVRTLTGHTGRVTRVQFSDDGEQVISAGRGDHTVRGSWHGALPRVHVRVVNVCFWFGTRADLVELGHGRARSPPMLGALKRERT